ncbi:ABC transporter permease [Dactylosporangium sucinum]|uniref:Glutathione ABC transporter permease n=1 Tax=Dactylosporangium sucinum TaxID=1424081 RepID=A0A917U8H0_9ACTN|nr:ABC transporter permease [Dactylosporangium sucinum]GGM61986.1 glutathione ABC transporter permease [Dactylosporangium sucinum]
MTRYTLSRLLQGLVAMWVIVTIVFFLARLGGDAAALLAPADATPEQIAAIRVSYGFDQPLYLQYVDYLRGIATLDFGQSVSYRQPVADLVVPAMVNTARLALAAFAIALVLGVTFGAIAGVRAGTRYDQAVRGLSVLGQSVPPFWLGMLLVLLFSINLGWLPAFGSEGFTSLILPACALAAFPLASIARLTRSSVLEIVARDQTLFERSKGVGPATLMSHILRNASLPVVTLAGIQLGAMFSGTIVVENLFAWPGVGQLAIQGIQARDFALIQGIVVVNTFVFVALLFVVDLSYGWLDPRVRAIKTAVKSRVEATVEAAA